MSSPGIVQFRPAQHHDVPALEQLIAVSARTLGQLHYDQAANEAAIAHLFGVDTELIADGTYFAVEADGVLVGCGGWSRRATMFGGDRYAARATGLLDPAVDAARIRAFFIAPAYARRGIASALLARCEAAAMAAGFARATLMATLTGAPFYAARGYQAGEPVHVTLGGIAVAFIPMNKDLRSPTITPMSAKLSLADL